MLTEEILTRLQAMMEPERFEHSHGVAVAAAGLARIHGCDAGKAFLAGLLHDCAKGLSPESLLAMAEAKGLDLAEADYLEPRLLHAPAGAIIAHEDFGVNDDEVLRAIALHTTGDAGMGCLDKIIYLADAVEDGRSFAGIENLRELSSQDLDEAVLLLQEQTIGRLLQKRAIIHDRTIAARNDILKRRLHRRL